MIKLKKEGYYYIRYSEYVQDSWEEIIKTLNSKGWACSNQNEPKENNIFKLYCNIKKYQWVRDFWIEGEEIKVSDIIDTSESVIERIPEKWYIKSTDESDEILKKWRGGDYTSRPAWLCSDKYWIGKSQASEYTEITLDQFKKYVLKEKDVKEVESYKALPKPENGVSIRVIKDIDPKKLECKGNCPYIPKGSITWSSNMLGNIGTSLTMCPENNRYSANIPGDYFELIEEIKNEPKMESKYEVLPIKSRVQLTKEGLKEYKSQSEGGLGTVTKNDRSSNFIYSVEWDNGERNIYEKIDIELAKTEFKKGDYIVLLEDTKGNYKKNQCVKQRENNHFLITKKPQKRSAQCKFDKSGFQWRYATLEEIEEYDRLGKPYDITSLKVSESSLKEAVYCSTEEEWDIVKKIIGRTDSNEFSTSRNCLKPDNPNCSHKKGGSLSYIDIPFKEWMDKHGHVDKINPKKWSKDSWVVCTKHYTYLEVGDIAQIEEDRDNHVNVSKFVGNACLPYKENLKWFATKKEAEVFAKTLISTTTPKLGIWYVDSRTWLNPYYIKLESYSEDKVSGEVINNSNSYRKSDYWANKDMIKNMVPLSDLTVIQKYLPEGHIDKKTSKFKVGNWYKFKSAGNYISRYKDTINDIFRTDTGYIYNSKYVIDTSSGKMIHIKGVKFEEVSLEEIQQYLPEGHEDKISSTSSVLPLSSIKEDKIYYIKDSGGYELIFRCKNVIENTINEKSWIFINDCTFEESTEGIIYDKLDILREATSKEKSWLTECEEEGGYVALEEKIELPKKEESIKGEIGLGSIVRHKIISKGEGIVIGTYKKNTNVLVYYKDWKEGHSGNPCDDNLLNPSTGIGCWHESISNLELVNKDTSLREKKELFKFNVKRI